MSSRHGVGVRSMFMNRVLGYWLGTQCLSHKGVACVHLGTFTLDIDCTICLAGQFIMLQLLLKNRI